jgi:hypothetical protein
LERFEELVGGDDLLLDLVGFVLAAANLMLKVVVHVDAEVALAVSGFVLIDYEFGCDRTGHIAQAVLDYSDDWDLPAGVGVDLLHLPSLLLQGRSGLVDLGQLLLQESIVFSPKRFILASETGLRGTGEDLATAGEDEMGVEEFDCPDFLGLLAEEGRDVLAVWLLEPVLGITLDQFEDP